MPAFGCTRNRTMKTRNLEKKILTTTAHDGCQEQYASFVSGARNFCHSQSIAIDKEKLRARGLQLVWVKTDLSGKDEVQRSSSLGSQVYPISSNAFCITTISNQQTQFTQLNQNKLTKQNPRTMKKLYRSAFPMASVDYDFSSVNGLMEVVEQSAMQAFARNVLVIPQASRAPKMTGFGVLNSLNLLTV